MNYFLAVDKTRSKMPDKSDRYFIVDSSLIDGINRNSIESIIDLTSKFKNENALMTFLITNNIVPKELLGKHFTICYKSPKDKKWTRCGIKIKDQSSVLFDSDAELLDPGYFISSLLSLGLDPNMQFNYQTCDAETSMKIGLLSMIVRELQTNEMYKYHYIHGDVADLHNYLETIKRHNYIDNKYFYKNVHDIICGIYYKYSKFDYDKRTPLTNKQNKPYTNVRHLFELALFFNYCKKELEVQAKMLSQIKVDTSTGEVLEEKPLIRTRVKEEQPEYVQLSIFDSIQ